MASPVLVLLFSVLFFIPIMKMVGQEQAPLLALMVMFVFFVLWGTSDKMRRQLIIGPQIGATIVSGYALWAIPQHAWQIAVAAGIIGVVISLIKYLHWRFTRTV